jgi:hypothetical protein
VARITLRFIEDAGQRSITATSVDDPAWTPAPRVLRMAASEAPLPPENELAPLTEVVRTLCADTAGATLEDLRRNILLGDPDVNDVETLGGYLFAVLLGPWWQAILDRFPGAIDLELAFDGDAAPLQDWPWEMAFLNGQPLIVASPRPVSFTRIIDRVVGPVSIDFPLRVLFIVGQMNEALRPGAEYLGIIRGVAASLQDAGEDVSAMVSVRALIDATRDDIETTCAAWPPHVVHLVAHGELSTRTPLVHLTKREGSVNIADAVDAATLCGLFKGRAAAPRPLPGLVVVNASQPRLPGLHLSFAASLIAHDVAAAIGMAGEVRSGACRVFTHALYRALAAQRSLAAAVAHGQRAAALHYGLYKKNVEWARPALFVSKGPPPAFSLSSAQKALAKAVAKVRGRPAIFCDRYQALDAFSRFSLRVDKAPEQLLAFEQPASSLVREFETGESIRYQIGKTLLLNEIEWHSLIDGWLPCFVRADRGEETPNNLLLFALRLPQLFDECRDRFGVPRRGTSHALDLARDLLGWSRLVWDAEKKNAFNVERDKTIAAFRTNVGVGADALSAATVGDAMRDDIEQLVQDVRAICSHVRGVVIILDDFDGYIGYAELLLDLVKDHGLGSASARAPVVLAYSARDREGPKVRSRLTQGASEVRKRALRHPLEPFAPGIEAELAYGHYLLSKQLAPARTKDARSHVKALFELMQEEALGVPSFLRVTGPAIRLTQKYGHLVVSNDEAIFEQMNDE